MPSRQHGGLDCHEQQSDYLRAVLLEIAGMPVLLPSIGLGAYSHAWEGADVQHDLFIRAMEAKLKLLSWGCPA